MVTSLGGVIGVAVAVGAIAVGMTVLFVVHVVAWMVGRGSTSVMVTDAMPSGFRSRVPAKMTSSIRAPRRHLADCSPSTQLMASLRLDFPQPLGPTMAAIPEPLKLHLGSIKEGLKALNLYALQFQQNFRPSYYHIRGMGL